MMAIVRPEPLVVPQEESGGPRSSAPSCDDGRRGRLQAAARAVSEKYHRVVQAGPRGAFVRDLAVAVAIAVLTWPALSLSPAVGLDPSWQFAITAAVRDGIDFGGQVAFTYGPLGFLTVPVLYGGATAFAALLSLFILDVAVCVVLLRAIRSFLPLPVAILGTYLVVGTMASAGPDIALPLVLALALWLLAAPSDRYRPGYAWAALGALSGLLVLVKVGMGAVACGLAVVAVLAVPDGRRRSAGVCGGAGVATFGIGWLLFGGGVDDLVPFFRSSVNLVAGYGQAMSLEARGRQYYLLALVVVVLVAALVTVRVDGLPSARAKVGVCVATALVVFFLLKEGFIRHDTHDLIFFSAAPVLLAAVRPVRPTRAAKWLLAVALVVTTAVNVIAARGLIPVRHPVAAASRFGSDVSTIVSPGRREGVMDDARASMRAQYAIPPGMLSLMHGRTVWVDPWEENVLWAYPDIRFDPLPTLQAYVGYTSELDSLDADFVASPGAPDFILRQLPIAVDGRYPAFEPPATQLAIECRYREVAVSPSWQLVERAANRCGQPRQLVTVRTGFGRQVQVPTVGKDEAVVASFDLSLPLSWHFADKLLKAPTLSFTLGGVWPQYRFIPGTAGDLHVIRPASTLGYSPAFAPSAIGTFQLSVMGRGLTTDGVVVSFYAMPMRAHP